MSECLNLISDKVGFVRSFEITFRTDERTTPRPFDNSLIVFCSIYSIKANPDRSIMQRLSNLLRFAIVDLESSEGTVTERLMKLKELMRDDFPTEENSSYKNVAKETTQKATHMDEIVDGFAEASCKMVHMSAIIVESVGKRDILKLLAIQRAYKAMIPLLKKEK